VSAAGKAFKAMHNDGNIPPRGDTMQIDLTDKEADLLRRVVEDYYLTLREEIYKTEGYQIKHELKEEETAIESILEKLGSQIAEK
jgi:5'(3')-deoxyribonucleotidase